MIFRSFFKYLVCVCLICFSSSFAKGYSRNHPDLVDDFYRLNGNKLHWYSASARMELRYAFKSFLDSCEYEGLDKSRYHYNMIVDDLSTTTRYTKSELDTIYTDALISYCIDINEGYPENKRISFDGLSDRQFQSMRLSLPHKLLSITTTRDLQNLINSQQCSVSTYVILKEELRHQILNNDDQKVQQLKKSINTFRWITHFGFDRYIVVNIAAAKLSYYHKDSIYLSMKIVAGKPATPTPRFVAYCNEVIFYPYWNVPRSIAINEILPAIKKGLQVLDALNLQVIDNSGRLVDPHAVNWTEYSRKNFPFRFRQSTGCDNALGVMKFNLVSPYSVYLHDTNFKSAFTSESRYFSHGCIRLEKPLELAGYLIPQQVEPDFLASCYKNQTPIAKKIDRPVPVFIVYMTADVISNGIFYYPDIYKLN